MWGVVSDEWKRAMCHSRLLADASGLIFVTVPCRVYYQASKQRFPLLFINAPFPHPSTSPGSSSSIGIRYSFVSGTILKIPYVPSGISGLLRNPFASTGPWPLCFLPLVERRSPVFAGPIVKLACILFSLSFTCIAALGIYCPTTKRLLQSSTDSTRQIQTLASSQPVEDSAEDQATAHHNDPIAANGWRFHVNIRFGVAFNVAEGANAARALVYATVVLLLAIAAGCTGFVRVSPFFWAS
jgi:hypothetical protein